MGERINAGNEEARAYLGMARVSHANSMYKRYKTLIDKAHDLDPQDPDIQRYWVGTRGRQERIKYLEQELSQADEKSERRAHLQRTLDFLKSMQGQNCRLVGNITSTETPLVRLMRDADHPRGVGLAVDIDGAKSKLMIDTGSSGILINRKLADKAGIAKLVDTDLGGIGDQGTRSHMGIAKSIKIGQLEFQNCGVEVVEERNMLDEDGFIGADVFESFWWRSMFPAANYVCRNSLSVRMELRPHLACTRTERATKVVTTRKCRTQLPGARRILLRERAPVRRIAISRLK
jgi:hypothetical protein